MSWKIDGVSVEKDEFFNVMLPTFGKSPAVVIFGADSGLKAKVYALFRRKLDAPLSFDRTSIDGYVGQVKSRFASAKDSPVLICMHGDDSISHATRSQLVERLRRLGAREVLGVYVKVTENDHINYQVLDMEKGSFDYPVYLHQIKRLSDDPPSLRIFSHHLVVSSED